MLPGTLKHGKHPFENTPEPRLFYANAAIEAVHSDLVSNVLAHKGLMLLVGAPGIGKTTLLFNLKTSLEQADCLVVLPHRAASSFDDLLEDCCHQLAVAENAGNRAERVQALAKFLLKRLESGATTVFLIDNAQMLGIDALEDLSWLTDLEKGGQRLVQIVLSGQPDLVPRLCGSKLLFVQDSAIDYCELKPLGDEDIAPYIEHRLRAVGYTGPGLFPHEAIDCIAEHAGGVPRLVNQLCAMSLHVAVRDSAGTVSAGTVEAAVQELSADVPSGAPVHDGDQRLPADAPLDTTSSETATQAENPPEDRHPAAFEAEEKVGSDEAKLSTEEPSPGPQAGDRPENHVEVGDAAGGGGDAKGEHDIEDEFVVGPFPKNLMTPASQVKTTRQRRGVASIAALFIVGLALGGTGTFLYMAWPFSSGGTASRDIRAATAETGPPVMVETPKMQEAVAPPVTEPLSETAETGPASTQAPQVPSRSTSVALRLKKAAGREDTPVALDIHAAPSDKDDTAALSVAISGLPEGARLSAGQDDGDGIWSLSPDDLNGLTLTPPRDFSGRLQLTVDVSARWTDGRSASTSDVLPVEVVAAADTPGLGVADSEGRSGEAIPLDIRVALNDADESERLAVTISGLPEGARLSAGYDIGSGNWRLRPAELAELRLMPPDGYNGRLDLEVVATAREANGEQANVRMPLTVEVAPAPLAVEVAPAPPPVATAKGDFVVQLAALRSAADANRELSRLQSRFGKLLGDTRLKIYEAEVNGVPYFRVRSEPVPNKDEVFQICARLKSSAQDCMVLQQIAKAEPAAAQPETPANGPAPISLRPTEVTLALAQTGSPKLAVEPQPGSVAVRDLVMARGIVDREPADPTATFSPGDGRAFAHARIYNPGEPTAVSFVWLYDDALYATVDMKVGTSVRWRTWSSAEVWLGEWRVQIVSADGKILAENAFTVQ